MRRGHDMAQGRAPDDELSIVLGHQVGDIGQSTGEADSLDGPTRHQSLRGKPRSDRIKIEALG